MLSPRRYMIDPERLGNAPFEKPEQEPRTLRPMNGENKRFFDVTPDAIDTPVRIDAELFLAGNLVRNLQYDTPKARIIGEIFRTCLPHDAEHRDIANQIEGAVSAEEVEYDEQGFGQDPAYLERLDMVKKLKAETLLMKGFKAFSEAEWEYNNGLHELTIRNAQNFAAYLLDKGVQI